MRTSRRRVLDAIFRRRLGRRLELIAIAQSGKFNSFRDTLWLLCVHPAPHDAVALKRAVFKMMHDTGQETFIRQQKVILSRPDIVLGCDHLLTVERPDAVTEALRAWLDL
jgi:hypothetical protein